MSTPTSKIRAGLDAIERAKSGESFNLANLKGAPASVSDLNSLANKMTAKRDRLKVLAESIRTTVEKFTAEKKAEYAELGRVRDGNLITDTMGETRRRAMLDRAVAKFTRDARKVSADERARLMSEIRDITSRLAAVRHTFDPVSILMRRTLADSKSASNRATYATVLASAGPVAVESALRDSVIGGNAALASAAIDRLSNMPRQHAKLVRFSKRDVAESLVSEEWTKARAFIAMIDLAEAESEHANGSADGARNTSELLIRVGQLRKELGELVPAPESDPEGKDKPTQPGVLSNEEWEAALAAKYPSAPMPENVTVIVGGGNG